MIYFKTCFKMIPFLGMILRNYFVNRWQIRRGLTVWPFSFKGPGKPFVCFPSSLQSAPLPQFVQAELLPVVTAKNLLKSTLLEDNGPQIYCGTALNFIKSALDKPLLS